MPKFDAAWPYRYGVPFRYGEPEWAYRWSRKFDRLPIPNLPLAMLTD